MPSDQRRVEIVQTARELLERDGIDGLTMRQLGAAVGMRAPSLYNHVPDKATLHRLLATQALTELGELLAGANSLESMAKTYRAFGVAHPQLYQLLMDVRLPDGDDVGPAEAAARGPVDRLTGDPDRSRAFWAFCHGMTLLEIHQRFPVGADLSTAWSIGIDALGAPIGQ